VRQYVMEYAPHPQVYIPQVHLPGATSIIVRTALPPLALAETVRKAILEIDPDQPMANIRTLEGDVHRSLGIRRATLTLLGLFAAIAISLACIGIYGVVSCSISQRTRELGIRLALGAHRSNILRLVVSGAMRLSVIGIVAGLIVALALSRLVASLLYEVKTYDPVVFIGAACLLMIVAVLAVYVPARRAAKVDLMVALRYE